MTIQTYALFYIYCAGIKEFLNYSPLLTKKPIFKFIRQKN